ncbi:MAG TPA: hypothetical protein VFW10_19630, partial [Steroidobacteraceae bacterium]|nr:hypothetical protein [Steroidobacteraceae bacterium]
MSGQANPNCVSLAEVRAAALAARPKSVADTGLRLSLLCDLLEKQLYDAGILTLPALGRRSALAGPILDEALAFLRREGRIEVRGPSPDEATLRYALTERGRSSAQDSLARSGYMGPAP